MYPLHFVQEPVRHLQHWLRDSLRCHSSRQLEARRTVTFGGLGDGADGPACRAALRVASTGLGKLLLHGLMARSFVDGTEGVRPRHGYNSARLHCGAAHEDEVHVLWDCLEWE